MGIQIILKAQAPHSAPLIATKLSLMEAAAFPQTCSVQSQTFSTVTWVIKVGA
jgi:hypothetical protein